MSLPAEELARSRPLPLLNPGDGTLTQDVLRLSVWVDRDRPPDDWNDALRPARLNGLKAEELAAVEAEIPSQSDPRIGLLSVAPDASTRVARIQVGETTRGRSLELAETLPNVAELEAAEDTEAAPTVEVAPSAEAIAPPRDSALRAQPRGRGCRDGA